ncbi:MAG: hypothetical protein J6E49_04370 [Acidaminococcaceae bacterium]|nr:hypothetical protein [Acidaminococcaceae bacterium]MBQ5346197.1 hypothetical protein [Acidaminococcaceae bacterium]
MTEDTKKQLMAEVKADDLKDLPEQLQEVLRLTGLENFVELCFLMSGTTLYIPKLDRIVSPARARLLAREFNGGNYAQLAKKFDITETWVRQTINRENWKKRQLSLFSDEESS